MVKIRWRILGGAWREADIDGPISLLMEREGLLKEEYIPSVNGRVVDYEYIPREGDEITLVPVVSGG